MKKKKFLSSRETVGLTSILMKTQNGLKHIHLGILYIRKHRPKKTNHSKNILTKYNKVHHNK